MWNKIIHHWLRIPYTLNIHIGKKPKNVRATILFIHGIGESNTIWNPIISKLPSDIRTVSIDLLGFGKSKKPRLVEYSAKTQARSVITTLLKNGLNNRMIIVGHSLGALVAVEIAKRYPLLIKDLILCSPPFYKEEYKSKLTKIRDAQLKKVYKFITRNPDDFTKLTELAIKYNMMSKSFNSSQEYIFSFMEALNASIINQTSMDDVKLIEKPIIIIHGALDPLVIKKNLKEIARENPNVKLLTILSNHDIAGIYTNIIVDTINETVNTSLHPVKGANNRL